jgi:probable HAF family extracellular repeat protein
VAIDSQSNSQSFLYSKGQFTRLNFPSAAKTTVNGINDSGEIVGTYQDQSQKEHGFLYFNGAYSTVDYPGALETYLEGINGAGQMTGEWTDSGLKSHGFVDITGNFTSFDEPAGYWTNGFAINDSGQIVGQFENGSGYVQGFLAAPGVQITPGILTYPAQLVGTSSAPQTVTLTNTSTATLSLNSLTLIGADKSEFSLKNNCGGTLLQGASCTVTITFTPKGINARTASLNISDSAVGSPQTVPFTAAGTYVKLGSSSLNFGSVKVSQKSTPQTVALTNTAPFTLNLTRIVLSGRDAEDFTETNNCGSSVSSGQSCTITLIFGPTATGTRTATLSIFDNGGASPQSVALAGTGT